MAPYDQGTIMRQATMDGSLTIELLLGLTTAETEVRNLPIAYRKCRYRDENNLKYFEVSFFYFFKIHIQSIRPFSFAKKKKRFIVLASAALSVV